MSSFIEPMLNALIPIINKQSEGLNRSLLENAAITLGRLALVAPQLSAPQLGGYARKKAKKSPKNHFFCLFPNVTPPGTLAKKQKKAPKIVFSVSSQMSHPHFCQMSEIEFKKAKRSPQKTFLSVSSQMSHPHFFAICQNFNPKNPQNRFARSWCVALRSIRDDVEKERAAHSYTPPDIHRPLTTDTHTLTLTPLL